MEASEFLSEIVIEILRDFSAQKRKLTVESLSGALAVRGEIAALLSQSDKKNEAKQPEEAVSSPSIFPAVHESYRKFLAELVPISKGEHIQELTALQERVKKSMKIEELAVAGKDIVQIARRVISQILEEGKLANDFLVELGKDLVGMEQQLFSYQSHNLQTYLLNDKFCSNLLSDTEEVNDAVQAKGMTDGLIISKLAAIGRAIAMKRQEDENRLKEADAKIAELQMSVHNYSTEIDQVTERMNELEKEVMIDALMHIHNRRAYELKIRDAIKRFHRDGQTFTLILMDVDHFKQINDLYGHLAGDKCLQEIAKTIKLCLRKTDFLARYGGEELVAILSSTKAGDAEIVAEKVRKTIENTRFYFSDEKLPVTISVGVTEALSTDANSEVLFQRVDEAMYRAKHEGRNKVCVI